MNSFYTIEELEQIGFGSIGENVKISRKASFYGVSKLTIGNNVRIDDFCVLSGKINIGNYVHIAAHTSIYGGDKGVTLNDYSNISSMVSVYAASDDYTGVGMTNPMVPVDLKNVDEREVLIGRHVIVGTHSVILPGVHLKEGSAFGAFSFINRDSEAWSINAGIPFVKIRDRDKHILELEKSIDVFRG